MNKTIAIIKGDGIGPEIVTEAMGILDAVAAKFGHTFTYVDAPMGGTAIDKFGVPLPDSSLSTCRNADSVLLGAVGGPKWDDQPAANRPERGLLKLREGMGLYTNVRPAKMFSELSAACPLRADIAEGGIDFVVVRELIGGVYFGEHRTEEANGEQKATDIMAYCDRGSSLGMASTNLRASWEFHCFSMASAAFHKVLRSAYSGGAWGGSMISVWTISLLWE